MNESNDLSKSEVDPECWTPLERLFAQRTLRLFLRIPEAFNAVHAKVMPAWDGDGVDVGVQTDAAPKLLLKLHGSHVCV